MAFTVEDGSIVAGANAYISISELDDYWQDRGVFLSQSEPTKQSAIIIATQYVDLNNKWRGEIVNDSQSLDWPRKNAIDTQGREILETEIPAVLKNAVCEYAKRQMESDIQPDVSTVGTVTKKREKVGELEEETTYQDGTGGYYGINRYPMADNWLKRISCYYGFAYLRR